MNAAHDHSLILVWKSGRAHGFLITVKVALEGNHLQISTPSDYVITLLLRSFIFIEANSVTSPGLSKST